MAEANPTGEMRKVTADGVGELVIASPRDIRKAATKTDFSEIGTTGLRQYGGFVAEEWLRQLQGRRLAWTFREMADNDPVIGSILFAIKWLARGVEWRVEDGADTAAAEHVRECMDDMAHTWLDFISEALSMLQYGWSYHETVYKRRQGPQKNQVSAEPSSGDRAALHPASSKYSDGKIGWRKLPVRAQETLLRWKFDESYGIQAMEQIDWAGHHNVIPIEKALLFRTETTRNNPEGRSLLRNSFVSWYRKKTIEELEAIGIERDLAGIPVATPPDSVDLFDAKNAALLEAVKTLVTSIRRDEYEGVVLPQAGWKLELLTTGGSRQIDTDRVIRRYDQRIATSVLADFVLLGQDAVGSYAMVDVKSDLWGIVLDAILDLVCEILNRYAIPRLLALNGWSTEDAPEIQHGSAGRINLEKVGGFFNQLALAGAPIPWSKELLETLFAEAGLPANFDDTELEQPTHEPEPAVPAVPANQADEPTSQPVDEADPAVPISKADQSAGAMIALYPSADVAAALCQPDGEPEDDLHLTLAFLGPAANLADTDRLRTAIEGFAATCAPLTGQVSGVGHFTAGPEPVTYASADLPGLPDLRHRLIDTLTRAGFPPSTEHGFTPHITLAYDYCDPDVGNHPLAFDELCVVLAGERYDFPLTGTPVQKADRTDKTGHVVDVQPALEQRRKLLENHLSQTVTRALGQLGDRAQRAYLAAVQKASAPSDKTTVDRIMTAIGLQQWIDNVLKPAIQTHSQRVLQDTLNTLRTQIGLETNIPDPVARNIIAQGGRRLGLADIEPQVRAAIMQAISQGRAEGLNPVDIARRIRDQVPAGRFSNAGAAYRSRLIAGTETMNAQRLSSLEAYRAAANVTAVELRDGLLPNSDALCEQRDGTIVSFDEAATLAYDEHPLGTLSFNPVVVAPQDVLVGA